MKDEGARKCVQDNVITRIDGLFFLVKMDRIEADLLRMIYGDPVLFNEFLAVYREVAGKPEKEALRKALHEAATRRWHPCTYEILFPYVEGVCPHRITETIPRDGEDEIHRYLDLHNEATGISVAGRDILSVLCDLLVTERDCMIKDIVACAIATNASNPICWSPIGPGESSSTDLHFSIWEETHGGTGDYGLSGEMIVNLVRFLRATQDHRALHFKAILGLLSGVYWERPEVREYISDFLLDKKEDPVNRRRVFEMHALKGDPGFTLVAYKILFDKEDDKELRKLAYQFHIMKNYSTPEDRKLSGWADMVRSANEKDPPAILRELRESLN
ncbi:MAG: hypothetical protein L0Y78_09760 [candidate division NC10 bacterium]|nr:hypothetical protein [candidate division NC10 bacterium]